MIVLYRVLTLIVYPLFFIFTWIRIFLKKEDKQRYKEKLLSSHFKPSRDVSKKLIWFHAASIGEFKSIVPIVKTLKKIITNGNSNHYNNIKFKNLVIMNLKNGKYLSSIFSV